MKPHNTKYTLGKGRFEMDLFPPEYDQVNALVPRPVIMDLTVGDEIALYWLDRTPFIYELAAIRPFRLSMCSGLFRSDFGPLIWLLFYVKNTAGESQPFASMECHLNPAAPGQMEMWRRLANQTHWHLTLLGAGNEVADFFEFENCYGLGDALDMMDDACLSMPVIDFMRAKQQFLDRYSMDDLYAMA